MQIAENNLILIVDDTPTNLEVLSEALADAGFEISVATNGENALKQVEFDPPELILLDIMMPGIDGFETCRRLKANPLTEDIPIIFMTALSDAIDKVKGLSLGAVDYITKPFQQAEVLLRIQNHVKLRQLSLELEEQNINLKQEISARKLAEIELQNLTHELEQRVKKRTNDLSKALQDLQEAQCQLVQAEKFAALGQLMAGIAHEINNPINFIEANLYHLSNYVQDLLDFIQLYQCNFFNPSLEIQEKSKEIELEYLSEDIPNLLKSMSVGTERISNIVKSLRIFSHHDEAEVKFVDIHEGIDSTLTLLKHRLHLPVHDSSIQIIKEYGKLPKIECYAGKINQVFMNILSNAIDALEERMENHGNSLQPMIRIQTAVSEAGTIIIRIADNGSGMSQQVQHKLFDPFFTTKPVGKGTGLGMAISHEIVTKKHNGSLRCISALGKGTEFIIEMGVALLERQEIQLNLGVMQLC